MEESAVQMTGGGKTVAVKKGEKVTFTHHATGKPATGTFVKKVRRGAHQYAHVEMPDNTAMHVPVHHISGSKNVSESEELDEKLTPEAKQLVQKALGPKVKSNVLRKSSDAARHIIRLAKTNPKNVSESEES